MSIKFGSERSSQTQQVRLPPPTAQESALQQAQLEAAQFQLFMMQRAAQQEEDRQALGAPSAAISPEEQARISTMFGQARERGVGELGKFFGQQAMARGLRPSDSPIMAEQGQSMADFLRGLEASQATTELDIGQQQREFMAQLAQQAFQNRLSLAGMALPGAALGQQMFQQRLAGAPQTQRYSGTSRGGGFDIGQMASGFGAMSPYFRR